MSLGQGLSYCKVLRYLKMVLEFIVGENIARLGRGVKLVFKKLLP